MRLVDVNSSTNFELNAGKNGEDPTFKVGDHVIISKYLNILENSTLQIGVKRFL